MPEQAHEKTGTFLRGRRWWAWLLGGLALAVFLFPLSLDGKLREIAARRDLRQGWDPPNRIMPMLSLYYSLSQQRDGRLSDQELDRLWRELERYQGNYPEFFWVPLAWLEARAGHPQRAREALCRARRIDPGILGMTRGPAWDPYRSLIPRRKKDCP